MPAIDLILVFKVECRSVPIGPHIFRSFCDDRFVKAAIDNMNITAVALLNKAKLSRFHSGLFGCENPIKCALPRPTYIA
jgi:hypothetical protein